MPELARIIPEDHLADSPESRSESDWRQSHLSSPIPASPMPSISSRSESANNLEVFICFKIKFKFDTQWPSEKAASGVSQRPLALAPGDSGPALAH